MCRPVDQNSRENSEFYPQKGVKPVYFCISRGFFEQNSREFRGWGPRNVVKIPNFGENFPGKIWISARGFGETRIFLHFWEFCRPKFPGIREKVDPRFSWKLEILADIFQGKVWIWSRKFRETRIFLHFGCSVDHNSREFSSRGHQFRGVLMKIVNFEKFGIFRKSQFFLETTFFVKYNNPHFIMSFIIVWTDWFVYNKHVSRALDEYRRCLTKSGNRILIFCNLCGPWKSDALDESRKLTFT